MIVVNRGIVYDLESRKYVYCDLLFFYLFFHFLLLFSVFAIQNGGACLSGPTAGRMFNQFGESSTCKAGKGGLFANDVYRLTDTGKFSSQSGKLILIIVSGPHACSAF